MASQSASSGRKAAVVGLGQMGSGIARNLDKAGLLGGAWDISPARIAEAQLSEEVEIGPPAALAKYAAVLFVVPSTKEIEALLNGPDGLLTVPHPGQLLIDLTTSLPSESKRLAAHAGAHGRDYLDCAMSGGAAGAAAGTVTLMIGGEADALAGARPFLDCIASRMFHLGAVGAGHTMKLLHNMICHTIFFATAEGCLAAERAGLDLKGVVDVLNASNARSYISEVRFPKHILSGAFDGRSRVFNLAKDLQMAVDVTAEMDQPAVFGPLTSKLLQAAIARGLAEEDFTRLYEHFEELVGAAFPEQK